MEESLDIEQVIDNLKNGGSIKTGVDFSLKNGPMIIKKDAVIRDARVFLMLKKNGIAYIPFNEAAGGSILNRDGIPISFDVDFMKELEKISQPRISELERWIQQIADLKREAAIKYNNAKKNIKKVVSDIRTSGGEFDYSLMESTVIDLCRFLSANEGWGSFLTKEIFSFDNYLFNHSINVCTIGMAILTTFNRSFSENIDTYLGNLAISNQIQSDKNGKSQFMFYLPEEVIDIATGFILHDIGKILVPDDILNKKSKLSDSEYETVKRHSFEKGVLILDKNRVNNPYVKNVVKYHHAALFHGEANCYPTEKPPEHIPPYVRVSKLADIYDAMTSKTSYKEANNPITAVTDIFRKYAKKDRILQFILHSFVKAVGIYPPGSIVILSNQQMAYVIDAAGPTVLPFAEKSGEALNQLPNPIDLSKQGAQKSNLQIDRNEPLVSPKKAYDCMPHYLREIAFSDMAR